jgi:hypothetical protein
MAESGNGRGSPGTLLGGRAARGRRPVCSRFTQPRAGTGTGTVTHRHRDDAGTDIGALTSIGTYIGAGVGGGMGARATPYLSSGPST